MKKQICASLLALSLLTGPGISAAQAAEGEKILFVTAHQASGETYLQLTADGTDIPFSALDGYGQPFVDENGRTQVPVRKFAETAGGTVAWDGSTQTVTIQCGEDTLSLTIGGRILNKNGTEMEMDTAACIIDNTTYIPLRAAAEALGYTVDYHQREAVLASQRIDRESIVSAKLSATLVGANAPWVTLDGQQLDRFCELFNQACMISEDGADFFLDTVGSYSGAGSVELNNGKHLSLWCRGGNGVRYDLRDLTNAGPDHESGDLEGQFLLASPELFAFLHDIMYSVF